MLFFECFFCNLCLRLMYFLVFFLQKFEQKKNTRGTVYRQKLFFIIFSHNFSDFCLIINEMSIFLYKKINDFYFLTFFAKKCTFLCFFVQKFIGESFCEKNADFPLYSSRFLQKMYRF